MRIIPIILVAFTLTGCLTDDKVSRETRISCNINGEFYEYVKKTGEWWRDIGFGTIVVETREGKISFPKSSCITTKLPQ